MQPQPHRHRLAVLPVTLLRPSAAPPRGNAVVGQAYSFKPTAADANNDKVTFTIANKPGWAAFNAATGLLSGTPAASDVGSFAGIEIAATDGKDVTALPVFTIIVNAATSAGEKSVALSWTPPTQNADGSTLTDLSGYKIHYGTASKSYSKSVAVNTAGVDELSARWPAGRQALLRHDGGECLGRRERLLFRSRRHGELSSTWSSMSMAARASARVSSTAVIAGCFRSRADEYQPSGGVRKRFRAGLRARWARSSSG